MIDTTQFFILLGILAAGFAWLIIRVEIMGSRFESKFQEVHKDLGQINSRLTVVETILSMLGAPIKPIFKEKTDP